MSAKRRFLFVSSSVNSTVNSTSRESLNRRGSPSVRTRQTAQPGQRGKHFVDQKTSMKMRSPLVLLLLAACHSIVSASVIGIDFGSDWVKVSIVKPGVPLDIVLNKESKRKTDAVVTFRDGIRFFGSEAAGLSTRYPESTFPFIKNLLGVQFDDPLAVEYRNTFSNNLIEDPARNTCAFKVSQDGSIFTVEEVLAMQLAHAKRQAEISGGEPVSGAVITVPAYLVHHERQAILDAAEMAGLRVMQLMNDGTAVALNYVMTRTITDPQYHVFFDMGAGSTRATLARFTASSKKKNAPPQVEILAVGHDRTLGGRAIDVKLQHHLAKIFSKSAGAKAKEPVWGNARSMARLLKEANRVKQILSANTETIASVEGLHEEIDFKVKVTRSELEALCGDYFKKVLEPIKAVLKQADLPLKTLDSLVLVGGAVRIPAVQSVLKEYLGTASQIAANVNQDEAAVLGAGFRAAGISKQFKVRDIKIRDASLQAIEVIYALEPAADGEKAGREQRTLLFQGNATVPSKKLMNFKRGTDFGFSLTYQNAKSPILTATVSGLTDAIAKRKENAAGAPKVKAQIELSESMLLQVEHVQAHFEVAQAGKEGGSIKDWLFGGGKKEKGVDEKVGAAVSTDDETEDVKEEVEDKVIQQKKKPAKKVAKKDDKKQDKKDDKKDDKKEGEDKKDGDAKEGSVETKTQEDKSEATPTPESDSKKITTEKVKLAVNVKYETLVPLTDDVKTAAKKRFAIMDEEDAARRAREEAMNNLEAFIYSSQDFLESDDLALVSIESQREIFRVIVSAGQTWLDDAGFEASTQELSDKLKELKTARGAMWSRVQEMQRRPVALAKYREFVAGGMDFLAQLRVNCTEEGHFLFGLYNATELDDGVAKLQEYSGWLTAKEEEQAKVLAHDTPVFRAIEVEIKLQEVAGYLKSNFSRVPKIPKKPKTTITASSGTAEANAATETDKPTSDEEKPAEKGEKPEAESAKNETTAEEAEPSKYEHEEL
ncbi:Hsp70 protein-domain-containing protein [Chytriomyces sp. MP71]|nr:Hsp70 protein-domain-containing protein [Chytriomyces sp. MP71]